MKLAAVFSDLNLKLTQLRALIPLERRENDDELRNRLLLVRENLGWLEGALIGCSTPKPPPLICPHCKQIYYPSLPAVPSGGQRAASKNRSRGNSSAQRKSTTGRRNSK